MSGTLPAGRRGRLLAWGVTLLLLVVTWAAVIDPLLAWRHETAARAVGRAALAQRMEALADSLPLLRRQAAATTPAANAPNGLLEGSTDAVAAAALQARLQQLIATAGASLASAETLPAEAAGGFRRIGVRVAVSGSWPILVQLLQAIEQSRPRLLIDDMILQATPLLAGTPTQVLNASLGVVAFRTQTVVPATATTRAAGP